MMLLQTTARPFAVRCWTRRSTGPGPTVATHRRRWDLITRRAHRVRIRQDAGMSTAEYAVGTVAAAAFAALLYAILTSDSVVSGLTSLVQRALTVSF
jgi:hypothetical protein